MKKYDRWYLITCNNQCVGMLSRKCKRHIIDLNIALLQNMLDEKDDETNNSVICNQTSNNNTSLHNNDDTITNEDTLNDFNEHFTSR